MRGWLLIHRTMFQGKILLEWDDDNRPVLHQSWDQATTTAEELYNAHVAADMESINVEAVPVVVVEDNYYIDDRMYTLAELQRTAGREDV